ncbi:error-prone DNA polymerase [Roseococcus sp. DSY-14]|uniref:error-prone DNA polymerase n=1 Tax=Roseococcus sp. DSY-14 TaxID=3369650 RepID=UPI00387AD0E3
MACSDVELQAITNFSFLRGASHPGEMFAAARALGIGALAITDWNTVAGLVRAWDAARQTGVRLIPGCRVELRCGTALLLYPTDLPAWSRLTRLLSLARSRGGHRDFDLGWEDVAAQAEGMVAALLPETARDLHEALARGRDSFRDRAHLVLTARRQPGNAARLHALAAAARAARVATLATGDVLHHVPGRRILQDVLTCIREGCTVDAAGLRLHREADRHLRAPAEAARLLRRHPEAVARAAEVARMCRFDLGELRYQYPDETERPGETAQQALERLTWAGARLRYPHGVPEDVAAQLRHELALIASLDYAPYFLTVNTIVRRARDMGILCQGRGSAANSAVCYVLGITSIDPVRSGLLFERFVSAERREPPDIDVDFEHERREEVIQWVYSHYGRERAALCATVMRYRPRGAVRDVGKALGLPEDVTGALAAQVWGWGGEDVGEEHVAALNLNAEDRRLRLTLELAKELVGFPRQLGTHPGGFVLAKHRLDALVPLRPAAMAGRQVIEWDKDDADTLGFMKVDVLGLGMLGCLRRAFDLLAAHKGLKLDLASIPAEDPLTYAMIQQADTVGTFQVESRAQMAMLPRHKPRTFYDLVIQVAVVRPGPIQGDMVHPYLRRREGLEPVTFPTPELERVLGKTLGVPLFQEQAMQVAIACAGFTPGEADQLRRAMATFKLTGGVSVFKDKLVGGMVARGYARDFAEKTFSQIEGFGSYGFPESHAASFALIAYASCWVKRHHPDAFLCALLNSQPMGFYAPAQLVRDAKEHGVEVRPPCVNASGWDCTMEGAAVRLGLRLAKGLGAADGQAVAMARGVFPYRSVEEVQRRSGIGDQALEALAAADAFAALGLGRRDALWTVRGMRAALPLFAAADRSWNHPQPEATEPAAALPPLPEGGEVVADYRSLGLSLRRHPLAFLRTDLAAMGAIPCADLPRTRDGRRVTAAGLVLVRQKPGSAKGVMFLTMEDETGIANVIVWPKLFERQRPLILSAGMVAVRGRVQSENGVTHLIAEHLSDLTPLLDAVGGLGAFTLPHGRGDEARTGSGPDVRTLRVPTRDFR